MVEDANCTLSDGEAPRFLGSCEEISGGRDQVITALVSLPLCTDTVIHSLESLASENHPDARALNDLAAAYYLRAQRNDTPVDLLRGLDAAERAVASYPGPEALFNLALTQEALGLSPQAIGSWEKVQRISGGKWVEEAASHRRQLLREITAAGDNSLAIVERLLEAGRRGDQAAVRQLARSSPARAQSATEAQVLPSWAEAARRGGGENAERQLDLATAIAEGIARATGDRYLLDCIERIKASGNTAELMNAYAIFGDAWQAEQHYRLHEAAAAYALAERLFARAGSPFSNSASLRAAVVASLEHNAVGAADQMLRIADYARQHRYENLWSRAQTFRARALAEESRYPEALVAYGDAAASFERQGATDNAAASRAAQATILRWLGNQERTWHEAIRAIRLSRAAGPPLREAIFSDVAETSLALGFPRAALAYQNGAVQSARSALSQASESDFNVIVHRQQLVKALTGRAAIEFRMEQSDQAMKDLDSAAVMSSSNDPVFRQAALARIEELRGQIMLRTGFPKKALAAFTQALALGPRGAQSALLANLYVQRAAVYRSMGNISESERDWRAAIAAIAADEQAMLTRRTSSPTDFSRLTDIYLQFARHLTDSGHSADAFVYAEKARLLTPGNLIYELRTAGSHTTEVDRAHDIGALRNLLPEATALLEYQVLDDRTLVWIVSSRGIDFVELRVGRPSIERFCAALQAAAKSRNGERFAGSLEAPYAALLAEPLHRLSGSVRTLIIVPDETMFNLPFGALRDASTGRYLIESAAVAVAGSATQYVRCLRRDRETATLATPRVLVMGDPAFDARSDVAFGLTRLPGVRQEVAEISQLYPGSTALIDTKSTVGRFLALAPASTVIHLALQTASTPRTWGRPLMLFAPSAEASGTFSSAELREKINLPKTRLVVLSGCSDGRSALEGLGAFETAFLGAGVPTVVASFAPVDDRATAMLMTAFHRRYVRGDDAAEALRSAQLEMLHSADPGQRSPLSWASFEVIGASSTLAGASIKPTSLRER